MKFSKITFRRKYNLGNFSNEEIDIEVDLDDADDIQEAINAARKEAEVNHVANNPQLYEEKVKPVSPDSYVSAFQSIVESPSNRPPEPLTREERIIQQINEAGDIKVLESFKLIVKKNPDLQSAYDTKLQSLQKQTA